MKFTTVTEGLRELGINPEAEFISFQELTEKGVNPIVRCTGCDMTMNILSPSVREDEAGFIWCDDCAYEDEHEAHLLGCKCHRVAEFNAHYMGETL